MEIPIIFQDEHFAVVNKPAELAVHKNSFLPRDADYLTKLVGMQTGRSVYNVHRLDAKTSGIIILAFSSEMAHNLTRQFEKKEVKKTYHAIVKGKPENEGVFNEPVFIKRKGKKASAITNYKLIKTIPTTVTYKTFKDIELSLVEINPDTGKWHQIRQHFAMHRYDIIGDTHHGDWTLNRIITDNTGIKRLFLHASALSFIHPFTNLSVHLSIDLPDEFHMILDAMKAF